jgi:hypothetical protein
MNGQAQAFALLGVGLVLSCAFWWLGYMIGHWRGERYAARFWGEAANPDPKPYDAERHADYHAGG